MLLLLNPLVDPYMAGSVTQRIIALGLLCGIGGLVYGAAALIVRAYSISELRGALRRAPKAS